MMKSENLITREQTMIIRGIAAIFVVISHYIWQYYDLLQDTVCFYVLSHMGVVGVTLFLLVSGYGVAMSAQKKLPGMGFWKNRFFGTYLPYLALAGIFGFAGGFPENGLAWWRYLSGFDYWFIRVILVSWILFFLAMRLGRDFRRGCFAAVILCLLYILFLYKKEFSLFWYESNIAFPVGVLFALYQDRIAGLSGKKKQVIIAAVVLGLGVCLTWVLLVADRIYGRMASVRGLLINLFIALAVLLLCWLTGKRNVHKEERGGRFLVNMVMIPGSCSLELYLLHEPVMFFIRNHSSLPRGIALGISAACSLLLASLCQWGFSALNRICNPPENKI